MKQIAAAFVKAQKSFAPALKSSQNPHFKSRYADLAACVEAVIDALNDNGIALMQVPHESDTGVLVETMFVHESGETMSGGKLYTPASKQDPQGYGSALTYARRYGLMAACGIAPEDDDGNAAVKQATKPAPKQYQASGAGVKEEAYDKLTNAERIFVDDLAGEVTLNHGDGATAALLVSGITEALDKHTADGKSDRHELKLALWWRLPSNVRSFIDSKEKGIRAGEKRNDDPVRAAA